MEKLPVYSIGHGTRKAEDFLELLRKYSINYLVDVRSIPYSRFNPQYRQQALRAFLEENDVKYVFMGDNLGGRPKDPACYNKQGLINYPKIITQDFFISGIERLKKAYEKNIPLAIMCSESKPHECHRSRLIGEALSLINITIMHIDEKGELKEHSSVIKQVKKKAPENDLFDDAGLYSGEQD